MNLKEARNSGIKYCAETKSGYTYISHDNTNKFYLTEKQDANAVFTVGRNGSLRAYIHTNYAADFHKELKKRRNIRRKNGKKKVADICNREYEVETTE